MGASEAFGMLDLLALTKGAVGPRRVRISLPRPIRLENRDERLGVDTKGAERTLAYGP